MRLLAVSILAGALPVFGGSIDVSGASQVTLRTGQRLEIEFTVGVMPAELGFQALGPALPASEAALLPGSSGQYFPGFLFAVGLEAPDGSVSAGLFDPAAFALGLDTGGAVLQAGTASLSGSERAVSVITAFAVAPPPELFGADMRARVWLQNLGPDVVLGLGDGYTMRSAVSIPGVTDAAGSETAGLVNSVVLYNSGPSLPTSASPEPATLGLIPGALMLFLLLRRRTERVRAQCPNASEGQRV